MFYKNKIGATGKVNVVVTDKNGFVKEDFTVNNLVVGDGLDFITARMNSTADAAMSHMAIGQGDGNNGASTPVDGDSTLQSELARVALSSDTVTDNAIEFVATFGAGTGTGAVTEAGVLNAGTGGTMLCRTTFNVVNKGADDTMTVTWTVTIS
jgi:hypothetical protein